ncbi:ABC transporter substrate-binding protein [Plantactinospora sonchi]|uniref:Thiamine pyrimidine synthase n=1 Tax=Plantactinospora sonchi TaxID=1544735 RepID=A0ABU7RSN0_9ACTN
MPTPTITRRSLLLGTAAATATALTACDSEGGGDEAGKAATEKVTILTGAGFQGREAPIFVARQKGWFAEAGLDVQVLPGKGTTENLKNLAGGQATFATLDVSGAIIEYTRPGGIRNFTLTSVLHQRNLACFVALERSGIKTPSDLAGKTISYIPGGINQLLFPTYAKLANFDASKIKWVNAAPPQHPALLIERKVDAISQFVPAVESVQALARQPLVTLPFTDYLTDLHGSAVGVSADTARNKPDVVRRFNTALLRGLAYSIEHPDESGQIYASQKETQGQKVESAVAELKGMAGYVQGIASTPVGQFDLGRIARNIAILQGAGAIPTSIQPTDIVSPDLIG